MMSDITVWGRKSSVNVQLVLWTLDELELDFDRIDAGFIYGVVDTNDFCKMNPNGLVPVIVDGSAAPIFESAAILRYLGNRYGDDSFWPKDAVTRAQVDKWAEWAKWNIGHAFIINVFYGLVRTPADDLDHDAITLALNNLENVLAMADARLATSIYIATSEFTLADIALGYCLYRYYDIDVVRAELPNLRRYYDLLSTRPAFQRHVMVSYDELRA
jgi:glutathione S-transferase